MKKELFIAVCDRLKAKVPELKWIDAEEGQLSVSERPAVAFPCCLIDMSYATCNAFAGAKQQVTVQFCLRVAFVANGSMNAAAPANVRDRAFANLDVIEKIHKALHWWTNDRVFAPMPLRRVRVTPERRSDGLKVYNLLYQAGYSD